jgi:hypothetical protein
MQSANRFLTNLVQVLCAYLGQLARLRDALASDVAVVIDERDQAALADREGDEEFLLTNTVFEKVQVAKRVWILIAYLL